MTTDEMVAKMLLRLNRSAEDDLFAYPSEYESALTDAHRYVYHKIATQRPEMLETTTTITSDDGGNTFTLPSDHYGEIKLYRSPGPPNGLALVPSLPGGPGHFWLQGKTVKMNVAYDGTIYLVYTPVLDSSQDLVTAATGGAGGAVNSLLPLYCDEAIIWWGCNLLAMKPGFLGDPAVFERNFEREWKGKEDDPSDSGILGIIMRQSAYQAYEGIDDTLYGGVPWWRGVGG